jgi:FecR protein
VSVPKIVRAAVLSGAVLLVGVTGSAAWAQPKELPARIVTLGGPAELYRKDTPAWTSAALRAELGEGDSVRTQLGGRVTLRTASGQALRLGSRSQFAFLVPDSGGSAGPTRVRLDSGWLWIAVMPGSPPPTHIEILAGAAIVVVRGTGVSLRRGADGSVLVQVHHGTATCMGPDRQWERTLTGPQELLVPASGTPGQPRKLTVDKLEATWIRWNADQDFAGGYGGKKQLEP